MASRKEKTEAFVRDIESLGQFEAELNQQIAETHAWIRRARKLDDPELLARWLAYEKKLLEKRERLDVIRGLVHQLITPEVN